MLYAFLTPGDVALFEQVYKLCAESIDPAEQKTYQQFQAMLGAAHYRLSAAIEEEEVVGVAIFFMPVGEPFCLLEYLVVKPGRQSKGLGTALVRGSAGATPDRTMLVEADPEDESSPDRQTRRRRINFYRRLGFHRAVGCAYRLPLTTPGLAMELMVRLRSNTPSLSRETFQHWLGVIYEQAYGCSRTDHRIFEITAGLSETIEWD